MPWRRNWFCLRAHSLVEAELKARAISLRIRLSSTTDAGVQELVAAGLGAALMPKLSVDATDQRVRVTDLDDLLPARTVVAAWQPQGRPGSAVSAFVQAARRAGAELAAERADAPEPTELQDAASRLAA